jgi:diacylglycerol kinase (ATP)
MRATLIHNPSAGDTELDEGALREILADVGLQVRYRSRKGDWKKGLRDRDKSDLIVVAGGDGTVAKVALEMTGSDIPLAILPLGTANNIARGFGIVGSAREVAARWLEVEPRPIDIGAVSASWGEQRFLESAGGGIFVEVIAAGGNGGVAAMTGAKGDRALAVLEKVLRDAEPSRWEVEVDGEDCSGDFIAVEAMNTRFIGPKVLLAPEADPGDGMLDVVLVSVRDREALLEYVGGRLREVAAELPELRTVRGRHVRLRSANGRPLHIGDSVVEAPRDHPADQTYDIVLKPGALLLLA